MGAIRDSEVKQLFLVPLKIHKLGDQVLGIPEKYSREILRNFLGLNFGEIPVNFSKLILSKIPLKNP